MPSSVPQREALPHMHEEARTVTHAADDIITLQANRRSGSEEQPRVAWAAKHSVKRDGWRIALAVAAVVVAVDQGTKWGAGGHVPDVLVNTGGDPLVGRAVGRLFVDRAPGALFDLMDALLLTIAMYALVRRRPPLAILVAGAVAVSGWASNVLDRLGLHFVTAPGSARGAVDFIHIGRYFYNVADLTIIAGTSSFALLILIEYLRHAGALREAVRGPLPRRKLLVLAAAAIALIATVTFGAAHDGGTSTPYASGT